MEVRYVSFNTHWTVKTFWFVWQDSTNHALLSIVEQIWTSLDNKMYKCVVFSDLKFFQPADDTFYSVGYWHRFSCLATGTFFPAWLLALFFLPGCWHFFSCLAAGTFFLPGYWHLFSCLATGTFFPAWLLAPFFLPGYWHLFSCLATDTFFPAWLLALFSA